MAVEVFIPFSGFYESWISDLIDDHIEYVSEDEDLPHEVDLDWNVDFEAIAKAYVELYQETLREAMEDALDVVDSANLVPKFRFKKLISPREYNFETDRILVEVDEVTDLWFIRGNLLGLDTLDANIKSHFQSRDGFASFYDDFAANWWTKPLEQWDCNELEILLPEFHMYDFDLDLTHFQEDIADAIEYEVPNPQTDPRPTAG